MRKVELLSPVGDFECLKAAVQNGANSVYLGAASFSARARATNFDDSELLKAIEYAKLRNVSVHLALNTLIKNDEFDDAVSLAIKAYNLGVDAIIIQDLGLAKYLLKNYPEIPLHASTQMTVHNLDGVKQLEALGFRRVVLSRELSIEEIKYIRENTSCELEVFIHGALCISYSGQCLLSSMIGGRSGNRGLCAQPCRLQYELLDEDSNGNTSSLNKGYLLSPRDNFGMEYIPELIKAGVDSFKIEGRMKTPTYVGVVTRTYRKYIDLVEENPDLDNDTLKDMIAKELLKKNEDTNLSDKEEVTQVFNRGGFSTGHFKPTGNHDLIFKDKPNNMGIYVGTVSHINENKGHLKLKLENTLSIGDRVSINNDSYMVSELMIDNKNYETLSKGTTCTIGRMKGKLKVGSKVYRIETAKLNKSISPTFKEDKEFKKVSINGEITLKKNTPISLTIYSNDGFYSNIDKVTVTLEDKIPQEALKQPITEEKIKDQLSKTGNTEFTFNDIKVNLDDNLFIPMGVLNELRRSCLEKLESLVLDKYKHDLKKKEDLFINDKFEETKSINSVSDKKISMLLNVVNLDFNYLDLDGIDNLYIPLKYFLNFNFKAKLNTLTSKFDVYCYLPHVIKDNKLKAINFEKIKSEFSIKGFVISHISQIEKVKSLGLDLIGNFNLNIYSNYSLNELKNLNLTRVTPSPELNRFELNDVLARTNLNTEVIVYGKLPVMTNSYCYLGESNKCYKECKHLCNNLDHKFFLKDRMDFKFRVLPDNTTTITTIFNSKTLSVKHDDLICNYLRIDILDESSIDEIQNVIDTVKANERFEGKEFTNGNL